MPYSLAATATLLLVLLLPDTARAQPAEPDSPEAEAEAAPLDPDFRLDPTEQMQLELQRLRRRVVALQREVAELRGVVPEPELPIRILDLEVAASVLLGNIKDVTLRSALTFTLEEPDTYRLRLGTEYEFRAHDDVTQQQRLDFLTEFTLLPIDPISPFVLFDVGFDEQRKLNLRLDTGVGVRWTVLRDPYDPLHYQHDPHSFYAISVALLLNHQQYQPHTLVPHRTFVRLDARVEFEQRLIRGLFVGDRFRIYSAIADTDVLLLRNEAYLRLAFGEDYWLRVIYVFQEDTNPAPGVRRVDHGFQLALAARFN